MILCFDILWLFNAKNTTALSNQCPVHKVTTVATGKPIRNFRPTETVERVIEKPAPSDMQTSNYVVTHSKKSKSLPKIPAMTMNVVLQMVDYKQLEDLPWYEETSPEGK
jgi:hypothetical protein